LGNKTLELLTKNLPITHSRHIDQQGERRHGFPPTAPCRARPGGCRQSFKGGETNSKENRDASAGGTGRFANATGNLSSIGEVDFATGDTVLRYSGTVCYGGSN
jgi:hypothetical protein